MTSRERVLIALKLGKPDRLPWVESSVHNTLTLGSPEETEAEVRERIEKVGVGGGYILASSNGLTAYCKPENVLAMNYALLKYGYYSANSLVSLTH